MDLVEITPFIGILLVVLASYFIASTVYRRMVRGGSKGGAIAVGIVTFFASAFVIGIAVLYLIFSNVRLER